MVLMLAISIGFAKEHQSMKFAKIRAFDNSYAFRLKTCSCTNGMGPTLWFTDVDMTNPVGSDMCLWDEVDRLHALFPGYQFTPYPYMGVNEFEYGVSYPDYSTYYTIYSDYWHGNGPGH